MASRQQKLVRAFSRQLDEDVKRDLAEARREILQTEQELEEQQEEEQQQEEEEQQKGEVRERDCCQHLDLEEVGIRVQVHPRGSHHFLYTVSRVLLPEASDYIREGDVLLKAGDAVVTSMSPGELRQFCRTQLISSCVPLIFGHKDALTINAFDDSREIEFVAIKVGYEVDAKGDQATPVGSTRPGCLVCSQGLLLNPRGHLRSVVKVEGRDTYLEADHDTLRISRSPRQSAQKFSRHMGFLEQREGNVWVTTLETEVSGQRLALKCEALDSDRDGLHLWLEAPPAVPDWPFLRYGNNRTWIRDQGCPFLFIMEESESNRLMELRPLHHRDFLLCLNEDGLLVLRREDKEPIFDFQDIQDFPAIRRWHSSTAILTPAGSADDFLHPTAGSADIVPHCSAGSADSVPVTYMHGVSLGTRDVREPGNSTAHSLWNPRFGRQHVLKPFFRRRRSDSVE